MPGTWTPPGLIHSRNIDWIKCWLPRYQARRPPGFRIVEARPLHAIEGIPACVIRYIRSESSVTGTPAMLAKT